MAPFSAKPWPEVVRQCREYTELLPAYGTLLAVAVSIADGPAAASLAGQAWFRDLAVTPSSMAEDPDELLVVSLEPDPRPVPVADRVTIEHRTATGRDDRISRPATEALPLFWRFAIEKFGI